eukprot:TRINITY_DN2758_c0_g1_i1.p1 TRINITY_DN2758_c0_g1~~TRINITY_DN2758_c0_g1_i1.p1  ORF type:complete len:240 (+),score=8.91 TRINITY_DN2758_c0_g1_i1:61-720(+)
MDIIIEREIIMNIRRQHYNKMSYQVDYITFSLQSMKVFILAFVLAVALCDITERFIVFKETAPFDRLKDVKTQKVWLRSRKNFVIDLPSTWWYGNGKWILYDVSNPSTVYCDVKQDTCPVATRPLKEPLPPPEILSAKSEPVSSEPVDVDHKARILPRPGPRQEFNCRSGESGKAIMTFYYMALGVVEPCIKYRIKVKVKQASTNSINKILCMLLMAFS